VPACHLSGRSFAPLDPRWIAARLRPGPRGAGGDREIGRVPGPERRDGRFAFQQGRFLRNGTAYVRWNDAHMLLALANYLQAAG